MVSRALVARSHGSVSSLCVEAIQIGEVYLMVEESLGSKAASLVTGLLVMFRSSHCLIESWSIYEAATETTGFLDQDL